MKKILLTTIFIFLVISVAAQTKSQRRIYLWDVTLSMKGYQGKTPDIYDDVVKFLEQEINSIKDENTEIVVLPFQESILERWCEKADVAGKKTIIQKIKNYNNANVTNTNIVRPIKDVQEDLISSDKNNLLIILTDGKQSQQFGGNDELLKVIKDWQVYSKIHDAYALYLMLTKDAEDPEVMQAINETDNIDVITEPGQKELIMLKPTEVVRVNIKDDKTASIALTCNTVTPLPNNIKVRVSAIDSIVDINQEVLVQNKKIVFDMKYTQDYQTLKTLLVEKTDIPVKIEIINKNELQAIVQLTSEKIALELINKPEKTLKISMKK